MADTKYSDPLIVGAALDGTEVWGMTQGSADKSTNPIQVGRLADAETLATGELVYPYWTQQTIVYTAGQITRMSTTLGATYTMDISYVAGQVTQRVVTGAGETDTQNITYTNNQVDTDPQWSRA